MAVDERIQRIQKRVMGKMPNARTGDQWWLLQITLECVREEIVDMEKQLAERQPGGYADVPVQYGGSE